MPIQTLSVSRLSGIGALREKYIIGARFRGVSHAVAWGLKDLGDFPMLEIYKTAFDNIDKL